MLKGYTGKGKDNKYKPMLFSEILQFYKEAPKQALRLFWGHLKKQEYREAINLLKKFLNLDISDETIKDFLQDEGEQIVQSKKKRRFPQNGFIPREQPYFLPKKDRRSGNKYWKSSKAEDISPTGHDMKTQLYEDLNMPKASMIELENKIEAMLLNNILEEEIIRVLSNEEYINRNSKGVNTSPNEYISYDGIDYKIKYRIATPNSKQCRLRIENETSKDRRAEFGKTINEESAEEPRYHVNKIKSSNDAQFQYDCVGVDDNQLKELEYIKDNWEEIDYNEFMDNVDFSPFEKLINGVPPLKKDYAVMFYKSKLENGTPVWVMKHSAIEYVFY